MGYLNFKLKGRNINFGDDIIDDIKICKPFFEFIREKRNQFYIKLNCSICSFDDLSDAFDGISSYEFKDLFWEYVSDTIEFGVTEISKYGIKVFYDDLKDKVAEYIDVDDIFSDVEREIFSGEGIEAINYAGSIHTKRSINRSNRLHFFGGGYGVENAVKGVLTAELLNLGLDIVRGIGDSYTDVKDSKKIAEVKESAYNKMRNNALNMLSDKLYEACFRVCYDVKFILESKGIVQTLHIDWESYDKLSIEINNLSIQYHNNVVNKGKVDENLINTLIDKLCNQISIYPYGLEKYIFLYDLLPKNKDEIIKIVKYFEDYEEFKMMIK